MSFWLVGDGCGLAKRFELGAFWGAEFLGGRFLGVSVLAHGFSYHPKLPGDAPQGWPLQPGLRDRLPPDHRDGRQRTLPRVPRLADGVLLGGVFLGYDRNCGLVDAYRLQGGQAMLQDLLLPWGDQIYQSITEDRSQMTRIQELLAAMGCRVSYSSSRRFTVKAISELRAVLHPQAAQCWSPDPQHERDRQVNGGSAREGRGPA